MSELTSTFETMMTDINTTNEAGLDFQKSVTEANMQFSAESAALDMIGAVAEKIANTVQTQARNISN